MNSFQRLFTAGDIVGAVGHCCLLGPGKTQPVARSRRQPPLLLPCRGSGQLPSPHRAINWQHAHQILLCHVSFSGT